MKPSPRTPSATSLPRAPRDEAGARLAKYMITMGIRIACFIAMVLITPYGWYTWVLGAAAVFLPYIAVVIANVGADPRRAEAESPDRQIATPAAEAPAPPAAPGVIRISETPRLNPGPEDER
ncbi:MULTISPECIES: DUF3099 domain-containing protein [Microbacterium]|uniref:DUF3099 domain-containing protein n=1 Tax=Microbacterium wangchenii TaxID=2541726 RepID=A0ABX5SR48_9MICO|nr:MULTISPECIES: DUF3099 domain-containing protein [Microbacterium]MCK6065158.1 DUF3099 domain-containing protein [Microbacterium sp. EYE_512]QBR88613.1 DUF3099 domain-containing protein [Microbacterium wangchenii]TFV82333.1 DUF3099 domain-containing protein [Microbacterium sp. dk485]TXK20338.1 DUF3099 domain-containing protein [Microbacterium wangchenii]